MSNSIEQFAANALLSDVSYVDGLEGPALAQRLMDDERFLGMTAFAADVGIHYAVLDQYTDQATG